VTGQLYAPDPVLRGDFARALAEFWADGPDSETPPGHWNTIANAVSDSPGLARRIGGRGRQVDRLEWDVKLYFALNGAVHDAAVAAWGLKGHYDSARPISMICYLAARRELPLVPELIETITQKSSASGGRHEQLRAHVGEIAVRAWRGRSTGSPTGGPRSSRRPSRTTCPATAPSAAPPPRCSRRSPGARTFPAACSSGLFVRGTSRTKGGLGRTVKLQWAAYFDAAEDAGISRLYGGMHIPADDFEGRKVGSLCGKRAWALARRYYAGSARA
jgi:hypothetical protein